MSITNDKIIRKLKGLEAGQERLYFVQLGTDRYGSGGHKVYFKNRKDALSFFSIVSSTNPIEIKDENIHAFYYKTIEKELDREDLEFKYTKENLEILLGSEVMRVYPNAKDMEKAREQKVKEIEEREKQAKAKLKKK